MSDAVKIYVFPNGGSPGWVPVSALCECGHFVAGHLCSHPAFGPHDMGFTSDWKHENYREHLDKHHGKETVWELEWVDEDLVKKRAHAGIETAYAKHLKLPEVVCEMAKEQAAAC